MYSHILFEAYRRELARKAAELHRREKVEKEKVLFEISIPVDTEVLWAFCLFLCFVFWQGIRIEHIPSCLNAPDEEIAAVEQDSHSLGGSHRRARQSEAFKCI